MNDAVITLDAHGTLLRLEPPAPRIAQALTDAGFANPYPQVEAGFAAEVKHYLTHLSTGLDEEGLLKLRRQCADVMRECLDNPPPGELMTDLLIESMTFRLYPDSEPALDALDAAGYRLAVVSNWDCSLGRTLDSLGVSDRFEAVVTSAEAGYAKPDPVLFDRALAQLDVPAERALHCGDVPEADCLGAHRAGMQAVHLERDGGTGASWPGVVIASLTELPDLADTMLGVGDGVGRNLSCRADQASTSDLLHLDRVSLDRWAVACERGVAG